MSAPDILFTAGVAASENIMIGLCAGKISGPFIIVKIQFKFKAFGILVIDRAVCHRAFIGAGLIGQRNVPEPMQVCSDQGRKSHQCGKRGVPVQIPFFLHGHCRFWKARQPPRFLRWRLLD